MRIPSILFIARMPKRPIGFWPKFLKLWFYFNIKYDNDDDGDDGGIQYDSVESIYLTDKFITIGSLELMDFQLSISIR